MSESDPFVERLKMLLDLTGLDAAGLSRRASLSQAHVGMLLRGDVRRPSAKTLSAICRVTGASMDWLLDGRGAAPSPDEARKAVDACPLPARDTEAA